MLSSKDPKKYCEGSRRKRVLPCCDNGNSNASNHLVYKHSLDGGTGVHVVGAVGSLVSSFDNGGVFEKLNKEYAVSDCRENLHVRWVVYCHDAFRIVEKQY